MSKEGKKGKGKWIVIAVIAVIAIIGIAGSGNDENDSKETAQKVGSVENTSENLESTSEKAENNTDTKSENEIEQYHPGDIVSFGDFKITFTSAEKYKSNNEFTQPKEGYKYVRFNFTFENIGDTDAYPGNFDCYVNNQKCDSAYVDDTAGDFLLDKVSPGRNLNGSLTYEVPADAKLKNIELEYTNDSIWSNKKIIFLGK